MYCVEKSFADHFSVSTDNDGLNESSARSAFEVRIKQELDLSAICSCVFHANWRQSVEIFIIANKQYNFTKLT